MDDAALDGDGPSCVDVVAGDHSHCDSGALALLDGVGHLNGDTRRLRIPFKGKFSLFLTTLQRVCSEKHKIL